MVRDLMSVHLPSLKFQLLAVASFRFRFWFKLITNYKGSSVGTFSFNVLISSIFALSLLRKRAGLNLIKASIIISLG